MRCCMFPSSLGSGLWWGCPQPTTPDNLPSPRAQNCVCREHREATTSMLPLGDESAIARFDQNGCASFATTGDRLGRRDRRELQICNLNRQGRGRGQKRAQTARTVDSTTPAFRRMGKGPAATQLLMADALTAALPAFFGDLPGHQGWRRRTTKVFLVCPVCCAARMLDRDLRP